MEQDEYFLLNPTAKVTGIDLAPGILNRLRKKHSEKDLNLILSWLIFDVQFGTEQFDVLYRSKSCIILRLMKNTSI